MRNGVTFLRFVANHFVVLVLIPVISRKPFPASKDGQLRECPGIRIGMDFKHRSQLTTDDPINVIANPRTLHRTTF